MWTCKHCGRVSETGMKHGGHITFCRSNPKRTETMAKLTASAKKRRASSSTCEKLRATVLRKIADGTWHNSFARSRRHIYAGQSFDGMWEVHLAHWFDNQSIVWIRNTSSFPYAFEGRQHRYTPDFYLPNIDCYVEVKGWKTPKDDAKWRDFTERLVVVSGSDLLALGLPVTVRKDWK